MFESNIWNVITTYYITSGVWLILTAVALGYIIVRSKRDVRKKMSLAILFSILMILNEVSYHVLVKLFDAASYYRFLWVIPYVLIVAYAFVRMILDILGTDWKRLTQGSVIVLMSGVLLGILIFTQGNYMEQLRYDFPQNKFLVDDDVLEIKGIIDMERASGNAEEIPTIACDKNIMMQYQTVDAGSVISTNRVTYLEVRERQVDIKQSQPYQDKYLLTTICEDNAQPDVMQAKAAMIREQIDYLIVHGNAGMESYVESLDCALVGRTTSYLVYRVNNHYYDAVSDEGKIDEIIAKTGLQIRDVTIPLSGDSVEYSVEDAKGVVALNDSNTMDTYLLLNDLHMLLTTDDATEEYWQTINDRYANWALTSTGVHSADTWQNISAIVDAFGADGILMAGDMIDFASATNYDLFQRGLDKISTPILYARADHDTTAWYNSDGSYTNDDAKSAQNELRAGNAADGDALTGMMEQNDVMVWDKGEYYIMAWNNSTGQLTEAGLSVAKEIFAEGKPIILVTHVPINSPVDDGLYEASKEFDDRDRAKLWGENCLYIPNDVTQNFIDMVVAEDSPVCAVLSGHLHFAYETRLNSHLTEYVFDPTFAGNMVRISVVR